VTEVTLITYRPILKEILTSEGSNPGSYRAEALRDFVLQRGQCPGVSYAKLGATVMPQRPPTSFPVSSHSMDLP
jgi:hypothetical protein